MLEHLVQVSAKQKANVVSKDEKESGLRMILNFGHTFGHALETEFGYSKLKHGEAVILGMKCALKYSKEINILSSKDYDRGMDLLNRVPLKYDQNKVDIDALIERLYLDKKVSNKNIRLILLDKIGSYVVKEQADAKIIKRAFEILLKQ